jgi:dTDP-glucose 4,6-dehydratase
MTLAYHRHHGLVTRIVRIFNTYGPRNRLDDGRVVPTFIGQALRGEPLTIFGDGSQTRSFCYVSDLAEGIYRLLSSDYARPVNLGNPRELTIGQFAELIQELTGTKCQIVQRPLPEGDPKVRRPDISLARRLLSWEPTVDVRDGLRATIEYFRTQIGR